MWAADLRREGSASARGFEQALGEMSPTRDPGEWEPETQGPGEERPCHNPHFLTTHLKTPRCLPAAGFGLWTLSHPGLWGGGAATGQCVV